jgi:hypothetical protein
MRQIHRTQSMNTNDTQNTHNINNNTTQNSRDFRVQQTTSPNPQNTIFNDRFGLKHFDVLFLTK